MYARAPLGFERNNPKKRKGCRAVCRDGALRPWNAQKVASVANYAIRSGATRPEICAELRAKIGPCIDVDCRALKEAVEHVAGLVDELMLQTGFDELVHLLGELLQRIGRRPTPSNVVITLLTSLGRIWRVLKLLWRLEKFFDLIRDRVKYEYDMVVIRREIAKICDTK
jgi:hypothetical protein